MVAGGGLEPLAVKVRSERHRCPVGFRGGIVQGLAAIVTQAAPWQREVMKAVDLITAALCAAWLLALLWISVPDHDLLRAFWSQTMAAWVQALGSVGALVGIFAAQRRDHKHREELRIRERRDADADAVRGLYLVLLTARNTLTDLQSAAGTEDWTSAYGKLALAAVSGDEELFNEAMLLRLPSGVPAAAFIIARSQMAGVRVTLIQLDGFQAQANEFSTALAKVDEQYQSVLALVPPEHW